MAAESYDGFSGEREQPPVVALTSEDSTKFLGLLEGLKGLCVSSSVATPDSEALQSFLGSTIEQLKQKQQDSAAIHPTQIIKAKEQIVSTFFDEVMNFCTKTNQPKLGNLLSQFKGMYSQLVDDCTSLLVSSEEATMRRLEQMHDECQRQVQEMNQQIESSDAEMDDLLKASEILEGENHDLERQRLEYMEQIGWLRTQNEKLQMRLNQLESKTAPRPFATPAAPSSSSSYSPRAQSSPQMLSSEQEQSSVQSGPLSTRRPVNQSAVSAINISSSSSSALNLSQQQQQQQPQPQSQLIPGRTLSLRQLKEIIEDVYSSKSKYDQKCAEGNLPRETMEQHLYTYLNQKYGLKTLILEYAQAILQAVKRYAVDDNDVAVFGKILKNEIDEEFRFVQRQLKDTVTQLLRVYLQGKFPLKVDEQISSLLEKKMTGFLQPDEYVDIVKYMYNQEDSLNLIVKIKETIVRLSQEVSEGEPGVEAGRPIGRSARNMGASSSSSTSASFRSAALASQKIPFRDFLKILLDFQLSGHEKFLSRFTRIFKSIDTDKNGIIDVHSEFRHLLYEIDPHKDEAEIAELIRLLDPNGHNSATYSECILFLSTELVRLVEAEAAASSP